MEITFKTRKLAKIVNSEKELQKRYGAPMMRRIAARLAVLKNARTLSMVPGTPPERLHPLRGKRKGQYAVDLVHPCRLILQPDHDPLPCRKDGSLATDQVTSITIVEVTDYH